MNATHCIIPGHEHGHICYNCGEGVHETRIDGVSIWTHDDAAKVCYEAPAGQERTSWLYTPCLMVPVLTARPGWVSTTNGRIDYNGFRYAYQDENGDWTYVGRAFSAGFERSALAAAHRELAAQAARA